LFSVAAPDIKGSEGNRNYHRLNAVGQRILLVEDTPVNQKVATLTLQRRGHYVVAATDGAEALEAYDGQQFDVILMDIQMPTMNGIDVIHAIRERERARGGTSPSLP